ncbi:LicD family-domain-containing protein [Obelidium mucronatum]|nr:LicD family-domain-containing protein [Obelidium mucronatum]
MYKNRIEALDTGRFVAMVPKAHFSLDNQAIVGGTSLVDWSRRVVEWNETATADVKYFSECGIDKKRDARFATNNNGGSCLSEGNPKGVVRLLQEKHDSKKVHESLIAILQAWSLFSQEHKIYWWISHGEMIGWFWNSKLLPWETDLDIQISVQQLLQLVAYNQTLIQGGRFLLDVSPGFMVRSPQKQNVIDARVIDVTTGYMMDITALSRIRDDDDGTVYCKSPHGYKYEDLMPLHETLLEGVKVWRPHNVMKILRDEYQEKSMYQERFKRIYSWDRESLVWRSSVSGVGCILLGFVIPLLTISF